MIDSSTEPLGADPRPSVVAVVLAAGKGTRMKSELPKVLCEADQRPLVAYVIDALRAAAIDRIVLVVGYRAALVRERFADQADIEFADQTEQLGTGHAVMVCRDLLQDHEGPVVVVTGDSPMLQPESLQRLLQQYRERSPACVLGTLKHQQPQGLGRIVRDEAGGFAAIVEEKDASDQQRQIDEVNMSTYVFDCQPMLSCLDRLSNRNQQGEYYITDVPGILLADGKEVLALPVLKPVEALSVNTVEDLEQVETALRGA